MSPRPSRFLTGIAIAAIASIGSVFATLADEAAPKVDAPAATPSKAPKPMKMDQPMAGEMKKEGMTKGDMKKAAEKKERDMQNVMKKEEEAMKKGN
ncbi:MAG TPA: hypothetical protein VLH12_06585 [Usitatibacter sp.]|nr:hypothetical protein [Usitatibacter sp.]